MSNPYTFVNWGLLGEGKEPIDGGMVKGQKIGKARIGGYADPMMQNLQAYHNKNVKVFVEK